MMLLVKKKKKIECIKEKNSSAVAVMEDVADQCAKNGLSELPVPMSPCMLVQLFKLLSAEGTRQLASRSRRKLIQ